MSKKDVDIDEEIEKLSRKTNIKMRKAEYSFDNQIKKLDATIERLADKKLKEFDENKELTSKYISIEYKQDSIDRYREKLNKI